MFERFLLYVDVLGFSDLVEMKPEIVRRILAALDSSPAYDHPDFTAIQFSDTFLVFNEREVTSDYDKQYCAMYLCEFVQNLQYKLLSSNTFMRAIITYGSLEDSSPESGGSLNNIRAVWGESLIKSYRLERNIQAIGTFVDETVQPHMHIFETQMYDIQERLWFVDIATRLRSFFPHKESEDFSYAEYEVCTTGNEGLLVQDLYYLKLLFENSRDIEKPPRIRTKYLTTWEIYRLKYTGLCKRLEEVDFDFRKIIDIDWTPWINEILTPE